MIQKKVCMVGSFAVGKTSLVSQFVYSIFSEKYHTTIGVKIDKKVVDLGDRKVNLILWDVHGDDDFQRIRPSQLRGAAGYLLVADGTRKKTLSDALVLQQKVSDWLGDVPFLLVLNKADLEQEWEIPEESVEQLLDQGITVLKTSAKTGDGVEQAFLELARAVVGEEPSISGRSSN